MKCTFERLTSDIRDWQLFFIVSQKSHVSHHIIFITTNASGYIDATRQKHIQQDKLCSVEHGVCTIHLP